MISFNLRFFNSRTSHIIRRILSSSMTFRSKHMHKYLFCIFLLIIAFGLMFMEQVHSIEI